VIQTDTVHAKRTRRLTPLRLSTCNFWETKYPPDIEQTIEDPNYKEKYEEVRNVMKTYLIENNLMPSDGYFCFDDELRNLIDRSKGIDISFETSMNSYKDLCHEAQKESLQLKCNLEYEHD
jgi:hypothetical protein